MDAFPPDSPSSFEVDYGQVVEFVPQAVFSLNAQSGRVTSCNRAFEKLTGWSREDWLGRPLLPLFHPADLERALALFQQILGGQQAQLVGEVRVRHRHGEFLRTELSLWPLRTRATVVGICGMLSLHLVNGWQPALPLQAVSLPPTPLRETEVAAPAPSFLPPAPPPPASPPRILVAESQAVQRKILLLMLTRLGISADVAEDGLAVLDLLVRSSYDLILIDRDVAELDGLETSKSIRQRTAQAQRPWIILMDAEDRASTRAQGLAEGVDDVLAKPVQAAALEAALARFRAGHSASTADPAASFDFRPLAQLYALRPEAVPQLVENFLSNATHQVVAMEQAIARGDAEALRSTAHSLKGSSSTLGAVQLAQLCRELEGRGKSGSTAIAAATVDDLQQQLARVAQEFRQKLEQWRAESPANDRTLA